MPRVSDHLLKSAIRLVRQSTTVPNTSNTNAFTAERSDMLDSSLLLFALIPVSSFPDVRLHIVDAPLGAGRESILPIVVMDSGFAQRAPRNDDGESIFPRSLNPNGIF